MSTEPVDQASLARIQKAVTAVRQWASLIEVPHAPKPGSRLDRDDQVYPALPTSAITWYAITSAIDHLDLGADLLTADGVTVLRPNAFYSLTRSALLAAAQALWILSASPEQRAIRSLLIVEDEAHNQRRYVRTYLNDRRMKDDVSAEMLDELHRNDDRLTERMRAVRTEIGKRGHKGKFESTRMISDVALHMAPGDAWFQRAVMDQWQRGSAAAHSRMWTIHVRQHHTAPLPDGGAIRSITSTVEDIAQAYGAPTLILSEALNLWDRDAQ